MGPVMRIHLSVKCLSVLMLTVLLSTLRAQGKPTVAILDLEGQDVSKTDDQTLTERMRTEIGNTNAVRLIERKKAKEAEDDGEPAEETDFNQS